MAKSDKPRSDSKVATLFSKNPELRVEVVRRLSEENQSFKEVSSWLKDDGHIISATALHDWYSVHSWKTNVESARSVAEQVRADAAASGDYDEATLALVKERAYVLARTKGASVKDLAILAGIIGDSVIEKRKNRELDLNIQKFRQTVKADIDKGLDALHAEIKGNDEALALFQKFKAAVLRSAEGKS